MDDETQQTQPILADANEESLENKQDGLEDKVADSRTRHAYVEDDTASDNSHVSDVEATPFTSEAKGNVALVDEDTGSKSGPEQEEGSELHPSIEGDEQTDTVSDLTTSRKSSRSSSALSRKASKRTEALIHAAARDIVAQIEHKKSKGEEEQVGEASVVSEQTDGLPEGSHLDETEHSYLEDVETADDDDDDAASHTSPHVLQAGDEGGDNSSHHEATDEDVFSNKSPRSSLGSYDGASESGSKAQFGEVENMTTITTRSPRISNISQYEAEEEFVPTARGTPRLPFRTPSDVRALQMSSPTPSVVGSPRSAKRHPQFPTVSRLGTPSASAQYSPKRRSTPSRFKSRQDPPLVLLHVTLLPLRWVWADLINTVDSSEMSEQAKTLRDAWHTLQDRVGDTVIERGILLGHPQNDYEVLEERLLEALELPLRKRARILECGHYLGPSNETSLLEDEDSEAEDQQDQQERRRSAAENKRHWCRTCNHEIRYESLGPGKIFRVKVYASNGLMKAGAWAACWKEMERVDVELEPVVESCVQDELVRLAAAAQQEREGDLARRQQQLEDEATIIAAQEVMAQQLEEQEREREQQRQLRAEDKPSLVHAHLEVPASEPAARVSPSRSARREERRRRDEERLREIYGHTPAPEPEAETRFSEPPHPPQQHEQHYEQQQQSVPEPSIAQQQQQQSEQEYYRQPRQQPDAFVNRPSPRSPSEEACERREARRRMNRGDSLPELLLQSVRVLMQDHKNVLILTLSVFVLMLALRNAPLQPAQPFETAIVHDVEDVPQMRPQVPVIETSQQQPWDQQQQAIPKMEAIVTPPDAKQQQQQEAGTNGGEAVDEESVVVVVAPSRSVSTVYEPCETSSASGSAITVATAAAAAAAAPPAKECTMKEKEAVPSEKIETEVEEEESEEVKIETVTEKKVVKVVRTVTQTQTQTQIETESATETITLPSVPAESAVAQPPSTVEAREAERERSVSAFEKEHEEDREGLAAESAPPLAVREREEGLDGRGVEESKK